MKSVFFYVMRDTMFVILATFVYIGFFGIIAYYNFKISLEGFNYFPSVHESFYQMLILLTTANFPDVMLPAYYESRYNCLFFIGYLLIGLYFMQNILLAIVFDNYKRHLENKVEQN
jgi:Ion transport protein